MTIPSKGHLQSHRCRYRHGTQVAFKSDGVAADFGSPLPLSTASRDLTSAMGINNPQQQFRQRLAKEILDQNHHHKQIGRVLAQRSDPSSGHVEYLARGFHQHIGRMSRTPALLADPQVMQGSERCVYFYKDASVDQKPSG